MNPKTVITKAIKKAVKNGYHPVPGRVVTKVSVTLQTNSASYVDFQVNGDGNRIHTLLVGLNDVLFDHDFAIGLWGDKYVDHSTGKPLAAKDDGDIDSPKAYKYHLQQLATLSSIQGRINYIKTTM